MTEENKTSSEVEEKDLAQEALDATEGGTSPAEKSAKAEPTVPLHNVTALRARAQQAELDKARLEGELTALRQQQTQSAPAPKSPLEAEIERQAAAGIDEEDMTVTPKVYREQQAWEKQQAEQAAQQKAAEKLAKEQLASVVKARGDHDDFDEVIKAGDALLTKGEVVDLSEAGVDFGERTYAKCKAVLEAHAKANAKSQTETETAPESEQSESEAEAKVATKKVPTQQQILKEVAEQSDPQAVAAAQL